jgi:para-nitrobenzyl esterase
MERLLGRPKVPASEDCLYLNIWSPAADDKRRPVLVWIHGGAFQTGSGSVPWYNGVSFAEKGEVVVVTLNYRLGILGFLHLAEWGGEDYASSGNCGLLDQLAALEWVRDNIAAFGGDPQRVTIFGESAGAMSVGTLLAMPGAKKLFQQAILQSGAPYKVRDGQVASEATQKILAELGLANTPDPIPALLELTPDQLLDAAQNVLRKFPTNLRLFQPTVDGIALPSQPLEALRDGAAREIRILIGTNRDEMKLWTALDPTWQSAEETEIKHRVAQQIGPEIFNEVQGFYADQNREAASPLDRWVRAWTARAFLVPSLRLAEAQVEQGAAVWMYRFEWPSNAFDGKLGACHALEIPFVWNNLERGGANLFTGDGERQQRQALAEQMHTAWIAFAHNGDPTTAALTGWKAYNLEQRATLLFNSTSRVELDPQADERKVWERVLG